MAHGWLSMMDNKLIHGRYLLFKFLKCYSLSIHLSAGMAHDATSRYPRHGVSVEAFKTVPNH